MTDVAMPQTRPEVRPRLSGIDRLRGLAVLLMLADHLLLLFQADHWTRLGPTRAAFPLFCLVAGSLSVGRFPHLFRLAACGVFLSYGPGYWFAGVETDVLVWIALGLAVSHWVDEAPAVYLPLMCVAVLQATTWPLPGISYEPGLVVALVLLGRGRLSYLADLGRRLPGFLAWPGRHALAIYVGHLSLFGFVVVAS